MTKNLYLSRALVSCFDDATPPAEPAPTSPATPPAAPNVAPASLGFTAEQQKFFNDTVAAEKRKEQVKAQQALEKTETAYKDMLANNQSLTAKERQVLEENLADISGRLRTKEQQAALEKKDIEDRLTIKIKESDTRATQWESRYRDESVQRSLQDAAVSADAFNASQVISLLRPMTKLVEDVDANGKATGKYKTVVEFPDVDAAGDPIMTSRTPTEAVKRMKELPDLYGNLFKSGVVSGIGAHSTSGVPVGSGGKVDLKKLAKDPAQFRKILKENPELLGMRKRG